MVQIFGLSMNRYVEIDAIKAQNLKLCYGQLRYPTIHCTPAVRGRYVYYVNYQTRPVEMWIYEMKVFGPQIAKMCK